MNEPDYSGVTSRDLGKLFNSPSYQAMLREAREAEAEAVRKIWGPVFDRLEQRQKVPRRKDKNDGTAP